MPISFAFDPELRLIFARYRGVIGADDIAQSILDMAKAFRGSGVVDAVHVFAVGADLSSITIDGLGRVKMVADGYVESGIYRARSALVNEGSSDAMIMSPLWRALCKTDPAYPTEVEVFSDVDSACVWLERDPEDVRRLGETIAGA